MRLRTTSSPLGVDGFALKEVALHNFLEYYGITNKTGGHIIMLDLVLDIIKVMHPKMTTKDIFTNYLKEVNAITDILQRENYRASKR